MKTRRIDFSPSEWLEGTSELDNATRGLYITACALIYARGGAVPVDVLRANCRDHGHAFKRQLATLQTLGKLTINDGQITNKRCANELQKAEERSVKARKSVSERWKNNKIADADAILKRKANHQPSTINHQLPKEEKQEKAARSAEFAAWYAAFPRHTGKGDAETAYWRARREVSAAELLDAIGRYRTGKPAYADWQSPAAWLNKKRWLDEYEDVNVEPSRDRPTAPPPPLLAVV